MPLPVVTEVESISVDALHLTEFTSDDLDRSIDLVQVYADLRLQFADAVVIATAERLGIEDIVTLDRRDFSTV